MLKRGAFRVCASVYLVARRLASAALVVWPLRYFDDLEERSVSWTAPRLSEWVKRNYTPIPRQRSWAVMVWSGGKGGPGAGPIGSGIPREE